MREIGLSRPSRRAFLGVAAMSAFVLAGGGPYAATAQEREGDQAEWPQSYEASPQMAVGRETTPLLPPATLAATHAPIAKHQDLVAPGGWPQMPAGPELKIRANTKRVHTLRSRHHPSHPP